MNTAWNGFGDKLTGISNYLWAEDNGLNEDDVVVTVDAYDVLVTPSIRRVIKDLLLGSDTPIVMSGESYVFPEELLAWLYPHNYQSPYDKSDKNGGEVYRSMRGKFLNAGVHVGQVKYWKYFLKEVIYPRAYFFGNDQHQFGRYLVESQQLGLVRVDVDMRLSFSTYKSIRMGD